MIVSMTGFGRSKKELNECKVTIEIKSVNHRFCEVSVRMPRQFILLEDKIKKTVQNYIQRGRVDVFVTIEGEGYINRTLTVDWDLVTQYQKAIEEATASLNMHGSFSVEQLLNLPDVFTVVENENGIEKYDYIVIEAIKEAAAQLQKMRKVEGTAIQSDIIQRLKRISETVHFLKSFSENVIERYRERLLKRINDFLTGQFDIDEGRILTEVAIFADKSDISEELTRLESHVNQFLKSMENEEGIGRKLDFLVQEMNREMNTIGSKANDVEISQKVVEMKSELEKIKEQVQNIE